MCAVRPGLRSHNHYAELISGGFIVDCYTKSVKDIEPRVFRQRLIIEGHFKANLTSGSIKEYLTKLSGLTSMTVFTGPYCWPPDERSHPELQLVDLNGFIAWKESGCHVYAFSETKFFTSDIYTCRPFENEKVVAFTREFINSDDLIYQAL